MKTAIVNQNTIIESKKPKKHERDQFFLIMQWLTNAVGSSLSRKNLCVVNITKTEMQATDGHRVHVAPYNSEHEDSFFAQGQWKIKTNKVGHIIWQKCEEEVNFPDIQIIVSCYQKPERYGGIYKTLTLSYEGHESTEVYDKYVQFQRANEILCSLCHHIPNLHININYLNEALYAGLDRCVYAVDEMNNSHHPTPLYFYNSKDPRCYAIVMTMGEVKRISELEDK